jgi:hypothetical protein
VATGMRRVMERSEMKERGMCMRNVDGVNSSTTYGEEKTYLKGITVRIKMLWWKRLKEA